MNATLGSLPHELLLEIFLQIKPTYLQVILSESRQAVYEVESAEWRTLRYLNLASRHLTGPACEALSAAERACNALSLNLFHLRGGSRFKHMIPGTVYQTYQRLEITLPLHFHATLDPTTTAHALFSFKCTFDKAGGVWVALTSTTQTVELIPITSTGSTPLSTQDRVALQSDLDNVHTGQFAPLSQTLRTYASGGLNLNGGPLTPQRLTLTLTRVRSAYRVHQHFSAALGSRWSLADPWHSALNLYQAIGDGEPESS